MDNVMDMPDKDLLLTMLAPTACNDTSSLE